jgi:hypothetical protein
MKVERNLTITERVVIIALSPLIILAIWAFVGVILLGTPIYLLFGGKATITRDV